MPGRTLRALSAAMLLLGGCRAGAKADRLTPADEAAARAVDSLFAAGVNAGNPDRTAAAYGEDAWLLSPGAPPVKGRGGIRGYWAGILRSYDVNITFGIDELQGRGDLAYIVGHYRMVTKPKSSEVPAMAPEDGKYVEVLRRGSDGRWAYQVDMFSPNGTPTK